MILVGLVVFGTLVGMISEGFNSMVESIRAGELKAVEKNHTLILGWSEGTVRLVCQIAFLRRQWQMQNESWVHYFLWWTRVQPSTPIAKGNIVIMCNNKEKAEMEMLIDQGFAERGISRKRTRLGSDVVCRVGDPCDVQALLRVGAHRAAGIVLNLAQDDAKDQDGLLCAESIRVLMALRLIMYSSNPPPLWNDLRMVVELNDG